jgi:hypothetical protein
MKATLEFELPKEIELFNSAKQGSETRKLIRELQEKLVEWGEGRDKQGALGRVFHKGKLIESPAQAFEKVADYLKEELSKLRLLSH